MLRRPSTFLSYSYVLLALPIIAVLLTEQPTQAQSPLGYWKFDEGSGTSAFDSSGNDHTALLSNRLGWVKGANGWAISANNANQDYVNIPSIDLSGTRAVTTAFWVMRNYTTEGENVLLEASTNYQDSSTGFALFPDDKTCHGIQAALRGNEGTTANCYNQPSSGTWHHLAVVYDKSQTGGNQVNLYVDGVLQVPSWNLSSSTNTNNFGNNPVYLFSRSASSQYSSGTVSDLRIYNSALTAAQIQQLYQGDELATTEETIRYVQGNYATPQTPLARVNVAFSAAQTGGDLNVVVVGWNDSTARISSVRDSKGNVYTRAVGPTIQQEIQSQSIYYAKNIVPARAGTNSVTVTFSTAAQYPDIRIVEYRGADTNNPVDVTAANSGDSSNSSSRLATTTNATDLIFGANLVQTLTTSPGTGFTKRLLTRPNGNIAEDRMVTVKGSYRATAPLNFASPWIMQLVAFRTPRRLRGDLMAFPASLNFGTVNVKSSASQTVSIRNTGTTSVTVSGVSVSGSEFSLSSVTTPFVLAPDGSRQLTVTFSPTVTGDASGEIIVTSNATDPTLSIALSGIGVTGVKHSVTLTWNASKSQVVGYNAYRSSSPNGPFSILNQGLISHTTYSDKAVQSGKTYYYYATAVNAQGQESVPSNHASATVP
jgi:hypothetical protein